MVDKGLDGRGIYRSIYVSIWDDPDFRKLSPETKLILLNLRTSPLSNLAVIYPYYIEAIQRQTGLTSDIIQSSLDTLLDTHWIAIEEGILWVKKGLRYDPNIVLHNPNHKKAIINIMLGLPKLQIVRDFIDFYHLDIPYPIPSTNPISNGYDIPYGNQDKDKIKEKEEIKEEESMRGGTIKPSLSVSFKTMKNPSQEEYERRLLLKKQASQLRDQK